MDSKNQKQSDLVKMITYLQKSDTIFLTRDSTTIRNVIDFVNLSKPAEQSVYFKSYRFLILEFDDQSHIRIETSKTYFRRNGEIYNSTINIDSILAENITDKSL